LYLCPKHTQSQQYFLLNSVDRVDISVHNRLLVETLSTLRWLLGPLSSHKLAYPAVLAVPCQLLMIFAGVSVATDC
jgi:hypothetical protein